MYKVTHTILYVLCVSMFLRVQTVILTRFARVTFNAAHKYLGLTSELLRTEKLINDIAFHPLVPSFYEGRLFLFMNSGYIIYDL